MGILQIAFLAVNLVVPYWLWTSRARGPAIKVAWPATEATLARILGASGGLNCPTADVVKHIRELCDKSMDDWSDSETVAYRQQLGDQVYACEVRKKSLQISITPRPALGPQEPCLTNDSHQSFRFSPGFVLTLAGKIDSMSYVSLEGERRSFSVRNCRRKLKRAAGLAHLTDVRSFEEALGRDPKDPPDYLAVNRLCWVYDAAAGWSVWHEKFNAEENL